VHAWNTFRYQDDNFNAISNDPELGPSSSSRPGKVRYRFGGSKTIISAIYNRIAIDVASVPIRHVRRDENRQYQSDIDSYLNDCLTIGANIDQPARMFRQDAVQSMFDWGVIALLPVDTTLNPLETGGYDIVTMRIGQIMQWYPEKVMIRAYDQKMGIQRDVIVPKSMVAIVENPLYTVMNEPNSTLQQLIKTLRLLDAVDEQSASGHLDIIIQLPYVVKGDVKRAEADRRRKEIEFQLKGSQYGIAYIDGTERVTQLNRPAENNLMNRVEWLTKLLYGQLGITEDVMNGTAAEPVMINYYNRTVEPILAALCEAMAKTFLTKTARSQGQAIIFIRDPFKLVPVSVLAEITDKFIRNQVASSNDMRSVIGWRPSDDPKANKLQNPNIPAPPDGAAAQPAQAQPEPQQTSVLPFPWPASSQGVNSQNGSRT